MKHTFHLTKNKKTVVLFFIALTLISIFFYSVMRIYFFIKSEFTWFETITAILLLYAEAHILLHSFGYFMNIFHVISHSSAFKVPLPTLTLPHYPPVAIAVASYNEPLYILKDTLTCFYNLSYPNKYLYLLDDTRYELAWDTPENKLKYRISIEELCAELNINLFRANWHGAKAGMINDFTEFLNGHMHEDFEYYPLGKYQLNEAPKYLVMFDADMNPLPDFVEYLVEIMEKNSKLAFVQTPQYYSNFQFNRVARTAGLQQAIFYEYICEGKSLKGAMFCCGTNVIIRLKALTEIGGFDEKSLTEDFATSLKFHQQGWESAYLNKVSSFGIGPGDLGAFFKQQFRWAQGTLSVFKVLLKQFLFNIRQFTVSQWWEYFLASTHYFIGVAYFIMVYTPIVYLFLDIPSFLADPIIYLMVFLPYIILTLVLFAWTLKKRKYKIKDVFKVLFINAVTFPVFVRASIYALLGIKSSFVVTPKNNFSILNFFELKAQIFSALACFAATTWGALRLYYEGEPYWGLFINIFWTSYNFFLISSFLYFNHPEEEIAA